MRHHWCLPPSRPDAVSRYELGTLIARRDGIDPALLPAGRHVDSPFPDALDVLLDSTATQRQLRTRLCGAREFLRTGPEPAAVDEGPDGTPAPGPPGGYRSMNP